MVTELTGGKQLSEFTPERLPPLMNGNPPVDVHDAVNRVIRAVDVFAEGAPQSDDITCMIVRAKRP